VRSEAWSAILQTQRDTLARVGLVIGRSRAMQEIAAQIQRVAQFPDTTVMLQGESGTGKDVVAHAIHALSRRFNQPFVPINCAALPDTLLETELFGVEAGAFTDAKVSREGYLLRADKGTLFLDEIGAMPLALQAKLLRFLETRSFRRVGGVRELSVNLRVISATNVDLQQAVAHRAFREDLYYRLQVITLRLPPLRERLEDIEPLVEHFLRIYGGEECSLGISDEAMELLQNYSWPGNVRELRSVIQRGQILCEGHTIRPQDLPDEIRFARGRSAAIRNLQDISEQIHLPPEGIDLFDFLGNIERRLVREALERCNGNKMQAAALLRISRDQLRYRLTED